MKTSTDIWILRLVTYTFLSTCLVFAFAVVLWSAHLILIIAFGIILLISNYLIMIVFFVLSYVPIDTHRFNENTKRAGVGIAGFFYFGLVLLDFARQLPEIIDAFPFWSWIAIWFILSSTNFFILPKLTEERAETAFNLTDRILTSLPVVMIVWAVLGALSGIWFLQALMQTLHLLNLGEVQENPAMLGSAVIFGASLAVVSVFGRKEKLAIINPQISAYVSVMSKLGVTSSKFLGVLRKKGDLAYYRYDHIKARNDFEKLVPWALLCVSVTWWRLVSIASNDSGEVLFTVLVAIASAAVIYGIIRRVLRYRKWREMWARWWNLIGLLSLSDGVLTIEFMYHLIQTDELVLFDSAKDMKKHIEDEVEERGLNEVVPTEDDEIQRLYCNIELYELCKKAIEKPIKNASEIDKRMGLLTTASRILLKADKLQSADARQHLVRALLYASAPRTFKIPIEMFEDSSTLFVESATVNQDLAGFCNEQLSLLEDTPSTAIPESVKWLPVIYSFAFWLATSLLSLLGPAT